MLQGRLRRVEPLDAKRLATLIAALGFLGQQRSRTAACQRLQKLAG
jgi:hypothetical protein